jgi:hypothetical protein
MVVALVKLGRIEARSVSDGPRNRPVRNRAGRRFAGKAELDD